MNINKKIIRYNYSKRSDIIKYIVIHDTGNSGKGAGVNNHFNYFNGGDRGASADYFVDDTQVAQFVEDYNYSWQCGDGKGVYGITNNNSIGIELCINSDGNYDKAFDNLIELTKYLMKKYNISTDRVVRHYDASKKSCPNSMKANNWSKWTEFKNRLNDNSNSNNNTTTNNDRYEVRITADVLNVRSGAGINYPITTQVKNNYKFTIVETKNNWGRLLSGAGWICLDYTERTSTISNTINVGDKVKIVGSTYATGQNISNWAKGQTHTVSKLLDDNRAILKEINSICYLKDLKKV